MNMLKGRIKDMMDETDSCGEGDDERKKLIERNIHLMQTLLATADGIDFRELRHALTNTAEYRGLLLVDIHATDGTIVQITL